MPSAVSSNPTVPTTVLVTGANAGIGLATATTLASFGPHMTVIIGARSSAKGEEAVAEVRASPEYAGAQLAFVELDITSDESIARAVASLGERFGSIDVLINNAGVGIFGVTSDSVRSLFQHVFSANVFGTAALTDACLPLLRASSHPDRRIVAVSSNLGSISEALNPKNPGNAVAIPGEVYRASKAAMNMWAAATGAQLKSEGISVIVCAPGRCQTKMVFGVGVKTAADGARSVVKAAVQGCGADMVGDYISEERGAEWLW